MAQYIPRTILQIQNQIIAQKNTYTELNGLSSPSQTAIWLLWTFIQATAIALLEQILGVYSIGIEQELTNSVIATDPWIYNNVFKFQYDTTIPQIISIDSGYTISYPNTDANLQIISRCAVSVLSPKKILVKVATLEPPQALDSTQLSSLQSYMDTIMPAGLRTYCVSSNPDQVYIQGNIYYNGQYSSVIQVNVDAAINTYLQNIQFGGQITISGLEVAILSVTGVEDIDLISVTVRLDGDTYGSTSNYTVYQNNGTTTDVNNRRYTSASGYFITEQTTNHTIDDSLQYIIQ